MRNLFLSCFVITFLSNVWAEDTIPKKYYNNPSSSLMGFILLNHSRILHEVNHGDGDFVQSVISEKAGKLSIETLRIMSSKVQDPYQFAKAISEL